jgi:hypothetical protein
MIKKAYSVQMTYDVSNGEKRQAEKALLCFSQALKRLNVASEYLNIMKTPFENNQDMKPDEIMKHRAAIRRFRDKSVEKFNKFKTMAFTCVNTMQDFATDTQTLKLMKSFISSIDDLEIKVNKFVDIFNDLESKDFVKDIVSNITEIQTQCDEIDDSIDERIKNHIQSNILASSWVDSVSNDLQMKIEQKTPLMIDLFNKRQEQLNDTIMEKSKH